jgi:DNA repair protein RecN (Recombination protein N)
VRTEHELQSLENAELSLAELQRQLAALTLEYAAAAGRLTQARTRAAEELGTQISRLMQTLGMAGGRFAVSVTPADGEFAAYGVDDIEFLVSANPGQALKGLAKVASGGELSRISLAVQVAAAAKGSSLCMVFDEVDSGIGGAIAEIVGRQLRELGVRSQVLCVTHLPQVAAQAHSQFQVIKQTDGKVTRTAVKTLDAADRVDEIARMLGGVDITDQARAHAREMLSVSTRAAATPVAAKPTARKAASETKAPSAAPAPGAAKAPAMTKVSATSKAPATAEVPAAAKVPAATKAPAAVKSPAAARTAAAIKKKRARS